MKSHYLKKLLATRLFSNAGGNIYIFDAPENLILCYSRVSSKNKGIHSKKNVIH